MNTYITYTGTFVKQNGQERTMTFIKSKDLPTTGQTGARKISEGSEVVYDVNAKGYRVFNWSTVQGSVSQGVVSMSIDGSRR